MAIGGIGHKPQDAAAAAFGGFESEDCFDRVGAGARHAAGRSPEGIRPEARRIRSADMRFQLFKNSVRAVDRPDVPSQSQCIAPMAIRMKQSLEPVVVWCRKSPFELRKPIVCNRRDGVCSGQHSCPQAVDLRRVLALHHFTYLFTDAERESCAVERRRRAIRTSAGLDGLLLELLNDKPVILDA
jgi:hypothetical protein